MTEQKGGMIRVLDSETVDKIAAGEVVERPASVVKELVENAIDAGATVITVEIREGGIDFIRVTDNGCGIHGSQLRNAFLRHATSKIRSAEDLHRIVSLGFRGEALSSIAAVSRVEVITKKEDDLLGSRLVIEGGAERSFEEIGAPSGTTFLVRNLFYNTPVRRKFLKQPSTEGGYVAELMEHLALSCPHISFKFQQGSQLKFQTSGNGDLKEVIYRIYGRDMVSNLVPIGLDGDVMRMEGYLGRPEIVRSNRNFEIYFINGRFIKSMSIAKAIEEGYKEYLMQHKFPFCILQIHMDGGEVDVNVHPTKMDVRFSDPGRVCEILTRSVRDALMEKEMIPQVSLLDKEEISFQKSEDEKARRELFSSSPEPFEKQRLAERGIHTVAVPVAASATTTSVTAAVSATPPALAEAIPYESKDDFFVDFETKEEPLEESLEESFVKPFVVSHEEPQAAGLPDQEEKAGQMNLFEERLLTAEHRSRYSIIGQVFDTYWMVSFENKLLIIDQHAAHEKVKYERLIKQAAEKKVLSQQLFPPIVVSLTGRESQLLEEYGEVFAGMGFDVEHFGGNEYTLRSIPTELYGCGEKEMFLETLDSLAEDGKVKNLTVIEEKIASMSCKAAVKGNNRLSRKEAEYLIDELLTLDNPYHCPHGRPTIITMTQGELERKFKRIV